MRKKDREEEGMKRNWRRRKEEEDGWKGQVKDHFQPNPISGGQFCQRMQIWPKEQI